MKDKEKVAFYSNNDGTFVYFIKSMRWSRWETLSPACQPGMKPTWSWEIRPSISEFKWMAKILANSLMSILIKKAGLKLDQ